MTDKTNALIRRYWLEGKQDDEISALIGLHPVDVWNVRLNNGWIGPKPGKIPIGASGGKKKNTAGAVQPPLREGTADKRRDGSDG